MRERAGKSSWLAVFWHCVPYAEISTILNLESKEYIYIYRCETIDVAARAAKHTHGESILYYTD